MAGQYTGLQKTYVLTDADGIKMFHGVVRDGENACKKPEKANEIPLGVVANDERLNYAIGDTQANKNVAVMLDGIANITIDGSVTTGDRMILGEGGVAIKMPNTPDTYNVLGFAEKDGVAGDVIPVRLAYHVFTAK